MTDASSKGLFPQLTDVLYALAESHAMLLAKIQSLRLESTNSAHSALNDVDENANPVIDLSLASTPPELVEAKASPMRDASRTTPTDEPEPAVLPIGTVSPEYELLPEATPESDVEVQGSDSRDTPLMSSTPESEATQGHLSKMGSAHTAVWPDQHDRPEAAQAQLTGAESEGRNYNFFDELDARLAGLQDQDQGHLAE